MKHQIIRFDINDPKPGFVNAIVNAIASAANTKVISAWADAGSMEMLLSEEDAKKLKNILNRGKTIDPTGVRINKGDEYVVYALDDYDPWILFHHEGSVVDLKEESELDRIIDEYGDRIVEFV
jgi:hypothetical protein